MVVLEIKKEIIIMEHPHAVSLFLMKQRCLLAALMITAAQAAYSQTVFDFNLTTGWSPYTIVVQPDQKLIIDPVSIAYRANTNGVADSSFSLTPNLKSFFGHSIYTVAYTESGIYVGGDFSSINGDNVTNLARFNLDGTRDKSFSFPFTNSGGSVFSLAEQRDGKILVGGYFRAANGSSSHNIVRLNPDGSLDSSFSAPANAGGEFRLCHCRCE
jgi:hypothetical protein